MIQIEMNLHLLREVVFCLRTKKMYHGQTVIGLDKEFMVKAHLLVLRI